MHGGGREVANHDLTGNRAHKRRRVAAAGTVSNTQHGMQARKTGRSRAGTRPLVPRAPLRRISARRTTHRPPEQVRTLGPALKGVPTELRKYGGMERRRTGKPQQRPRKGPTYYLDFTIIIPHGPTH